MLKHMWGKTMNRDGTQNRSESTGSGNRKPVDIDAAWQKIHPLLRIKLGEDVYTSWFASMVLDDVNGDAARVTVPVKFLQTWIQSHYSDELLSSIQSQFKAVSRVDIALRQPGAYQQKPKDVITGVSAGQLTGGAGTAQSGVWPNGFAVGQPLVRTEANGFEGSPLDPRYTFDSVRGWCVQPYAACCSRSDGGRRSWLSSLASIRSSFTVPSVWVRPISCMRLPGT